MKRVLINSDYVCSAGEREGSEKEANSELRPQSAGVALILALIMLSVLVILIGQFQYSASVDARIAENYAFDRENYYAARGALNLAVALIAKDANDPDKSRTDTLNDDWAESDVLRGLTIGGVSTVIEVKDQERFLNINELNRLKVGSLGYKWVKDSLARLIANLGIDVEANLAERIADWVDADSDGEYEEGARNERFTTIEEMLQIPGMTKSILYGYIDEGENEHEGLASYITLWGTGRVNINTAPQTILLAISPEMTTEDVSKILSYREDTETHPQGFVTVGNLSEATDILTRDAQLAGRLTVSSTFFGVSIAANKGYLKMQVKAIVGRVKDPEGRNIVKQYFWKERQASKSSPFTTALT